ncbi:MAG: ABC transporter ATP-binding protein [bacterium]|nr:ABC transporter ATP-binding protein [bacterium]
MSSLLSVRGLTKRYSGFELRDVSLDLPPGYIMGLIGPNGAGKTTTLKSILGLLRRDGGEIRVDGADPLRDGAAARAAIGFVHDEPRFHRYLTLRTISRIVARFYARWNDATFLRLLRSFGLEPGRRFGTLSRGNRMKFALALALSHHARLIVLDEPTSGLDPVFRRDLLDLLQTQLVDEECSVLFSTHLTADLDRIADYVTLLQGGRVVFSQSKEEILDRWKLVKGGLDALDSSASDLFRGMRRGPHGFEALTDDADAVRRKFGDSLVFERATFEEIVLLTTAEGGDA